MKKTLKKQLVDWIKQKGYVSFGEIEKECAAGSYGRFGRMYKADTARRKLQDVMNPKNLTHYDPDINSDEVNGYIKGYKYVGQPIVYRQYRVVDHNGSVERIINLVK